MPKMNAYSVFDMKGSCYSLPFFAPNHGTAIRSFGDAVRDSKSPWNAHPEDYILRFVGSFDDESAVLGHVHAVHIAHATDFVQGSNPAPVALPIPVQANGEGGFLNKALEIMTGGRK